MRTIPAGRNLGQLYKPLTHGGNFWRDQYRLIDWDQCKRVVVHRGETHHGYSLLRRLGDTCWLTKDPATGYDSLFTFPASDNSANPAASEYLTVKFLSRGRGNELEMRRYLARECSSPFISKLRDHFSIRHHLAAIDATYKDVQFDAIVYQTTGTDLRRESATGESPSPPGLGQRVRCIRQVVAGVAELHRLGVVHGGRPRDGLPRPRRANRSDLQPGNVALAPPTREDMERLLEREPLEYPVVRKDGTPTPRNLPRYVTEPESIGFGDGGIQLLDFEYSFRPEPGAAYGKDAFAIGTPLPPELIGPGATTTEPFKVDSWHLGQLVRRLPARFFSMLTRLDVFRPCGWLLHLPPRLGASWQRHAKAVRALPR